MEDHVPLKGILCWVPCSLVEGKGCNGCSALTCAQFHDICDRWVGSQHPGRSPPVQSPCLLKRSIKADPRGSFETVSSLACCSLVSVGMSALQQVWSGQVQAGIPSAYQDQARQEVLETVFFWRHSLVSRLHHFGVDGEGWHTDHGIQPRVEVVDVLQGII